MGALRPWHIIVLVVVLILLFGSTRLPKATSALVKSLRIIKAETKSLSNDDEQTPAQQQQQPPPAGQQQRPPAANGYQAPPVVDPVDRTRDR